MSTKEEFQKAIELVIACKASVSCGCEIDEEKADCLYYQCKSYIEAYRKRMEQV